MDQQGSELPKARFFMWHSVEILGIYAIQRIGDFRFCGPFGTFRFVTKKSFGLGLDLVRQEN